MKTLVYGLVLGLGLSVSTIAFSQEGLRTEREEKVIALAKIAGMKSVVHVISKMDYSCETVKDCTVLPMGKRACGGPSSFVLASKNNESFGGIVEAIKAVTKAERQAIKDFGLRSTCMALEAPEIGCVENECTELQ